MYTHGAEGQAENPPGPGAPYPKQQALPSVQKFFGRFPHPLYFCNSSLDFLSRKAEGNGPMKP